MAQVINTNSLSLITQNNINKNQSALSSSIERLSSGLRINSAKDDAAGQAIANRFTSNIKGLTQAARNANDGISVAQTTEGALSEINNNLQRVRELTVQATTGTNSKSDLDSIQDEIKSRLDEIDRVSGQTQFNGVNVLSKDGSMKIQVGANDGETITIDLKKIDSSTLKLTGFNVNGKGETANTAATLKDMVGLKLDNTGVTTAGVNRYIADKAVASSTDILNAVAGVDGSKVSTEADVGFGAAPTAGTPVEYTYHKDTNTYTASSSVDATQLAAFLNPEAGGTTAATVSIGDGSTAQEQKVIIAKDGSLTAADDGAALYLDSKGNLSKTNAGTDAQAKLSGLMANNTNAKTVITTDKGTFTANAANDGFDGVDISVDASTFANAVKNETYTATVGVTLPSTYTVTDGTAASAYLVDGKVSKTPAEYFAQADGTITSGENASTSKSIYVSANGNLTTNTTSASEATTNPLAALDDAIASIDKFRSSLGAIQNRLDSAVTNLNNTTTNLSEAQSRIQDADYATEVSNMSKAQIIQQAGNSVLAKANQVPQQVLSLLQG
ncbi:FliC/FljB family flagellin [Kluyvera sichuanensis]|uniref:Flagellin n=1 Tax=Kluyvera sichuanensis TaxID=2725494 RepID=A0ABR6RYR4_9ENTR|nr:FliC/FljB family flagellin [Kluyvera sichuanensis]MBC1188278.1 FliC/FljB family flagellin [Kluyvera sichuanensis]